LKRKIVLTAIILTIYTLISTSVTFAQPVIQLWLHTDRASYGYGDEGTLSITIRNNGPGAIEIERITVTFPWFGWYHEAWDGNYTEAIANGAVGEDGSETYIVEFIVPSESRDRWTDNEAEVNVRYKYGLETDSMERTISISVMAQVYNENIMPIYYLTAVLTIATLVVIIELYFVWKRLGKIAHTPTAA
jgi:hypothetical protein